MDEIKKFSEIFDENLNENNFFCGKKIVNEICVNCECFLNEKNVFCLSCFKNCNEKHFFHKKNLKFIKNGICDCGKKFFCFEHEKKK